MAQQKPFRFGPIALTNTLTTNLLNPAAAGAGTGYTPTASVITITKLRIVNKTAGSVTFSLWIGLTGANTAGTEFLGIGAAVPANSSVEYNGRLVLAAADFLVGGASANTSLTMHGEGEIGLV